jgi:hypothetical protein
MKKRNTAIRRILKCIESEYDVQGEFLLWETSVTAVQKGSDVDIETFTSVFNLLRFLHLITVSDWSVYSKTYLIGNTHPKYKRIWIPSKVVQPHLLRLPESPKRDSTRLRYHLVHYQIQIELVKSGLFAYLGDNLEGPEFSVMKPLLTSYLKTAQFRQSKISELISKNYRKVAVTKVFPEITKCMDSEISTSFGYFIENKGVMGSLGRGEKNIPTIIRLLSNILSNSDKIKIKTTNYNNSNKIKKSNKDSGDIFPVPIQPAFCANSKQVHFKDTKLLQDKQQILDSFWNARKSVYGIYRTFRMAEGNLKYSPNLPWRFRKPVNAVRNINKAAIYPIPPFKLFTAVLSHYARTHNQHAPSGNWFASDAFYDSAEIFARAYDELEQFKHGAEKIGNRKIVPNEIEQFEAIKKLFSRVFEKKFGMRVDSYFGPYLDFYTDWCLFCAVLDFRIAKTYFEHRTKIEASPLSYVLAQVDYLRRRADKYPIHMEWIFGVQARSRMEQWILENASDSFISSERKRQLAQFFARQ